MNISVELSDQDARDIAEFLKRLSWSEIRACAVDEGETYRMRDALEKVRASLAEQGVAPR